MADTELTIKTGLDISGAKAGADELRKVNTKLQADIEARANKALGSETAANQKAMESRRQARTNLADAEMRISRRSQDQETRSRRTMADEAVRGYSRIGEAARRAGSMAAEAFGGLSLASVGLKTSLSGLAEAALSIGAAKGVANAIEAALKGANDEADRQLDKLRATKNLVAEIAAMTGGKEGSSDAEVQKHLNVRRASGLDQAEAQAFSLEFHGASEAAVGVNISEKEQKRAEPMLARLAETQGDGTDNAAQVGKLGGLIAGLDPVGSAEELTAKTSQTIKVLSEGVGANAVLIKQLAQVMGAYSSEDGKALFGSTKELASHIATASKVNPEQAGEIVKSTARVLGGFSEQWAPLLKKAGIEESDDYSTRSHKLNDHLEQVENSGRRVDAYLSEEGVDAAGAGHIQATYKYRNTTYKSLEKNKKSMTGAEANAEINTKFATDNRIKTDVAQAKLDEAEAHTAMNKQYAKPIELDAEAALEKEGMGKSSGLAAVKDWATGMVNSVGGLASGGMSVQDLGHKINLEGKMKEVVEARGQKVPEAESGIGDAAANFLPRLLLNALPLPQALTQAVPLPKLLSPEARARVVSGETTSLYSALNQEQELGVRVGGEGGDGSVKVPASKGKGRRLGQDPAADASTLEAINKEQAATLKEIGNTLKQRLPQAAPPRPIAMRPNPGPTR